MAETKDTLKSDISKFIKKMLEQRGISVYKIVFFGSFAKGQEKEESDIDIIIVSKDFRSKSIFEIVEETAGINRELVKKTGKPFDIMYYSDLEWKKSSSPIINAAKKEGEAAYG
ncbi:MAG: nucleotidyltransferase domain-containing protein [Spirochaetota bacterium]